MKALRSLFELNPSVVNGMLEAFSNHELGQSAWFKLHQM